MDKMANKTADAIMIVTDCLEKMRAGERDYDVFLRKIERSIALLREVENDLYEKRIDDMIKDLDEMHAEIEKNRSIK